MFNPELLKKLSLLGFPQLVEDLQTGDCTQNEALSVVERSRKSMTQEEFPEVEYERAIAQLEKLFEDS